MKIIGITGGIGSGKSEVSRRMEKLGYPVYYADIESKRILATHPVAIAEIKKLLGYKSYFENGEPNKEFISGKIFSNNELRESVNKILHPLVAADFENFVKMHSNSDFIFHEAALIYQVGFDKFMDSVIFVSCPESIRMDRVLKRDSLSIENISARIKAQGNLSEYEKKASFVVKNDGSYHDLESEVTNVINKLKHND